MTTNSTPRLRFLGEENVHGVLTEAQRILDEVGVMVEHAPAVELLDGGGARVSDDGRVRIAPELVERALGTVPSEIVLYDRAGENPVHLGSGARAFAPGSAALNVHDLALNGIRPATREDCRKFAHLTEHLTALSLQSTCVVPGYVPPALQDRHRLRDALVYGRKPIVTGTFTNEAFGVMARMLETARGGAEQLRARPLAIFDCCATAPLAWSELTCSALVGAARRGIPAALISMPMTGATAPVTLAGAVTQHAAENLSGVVIHQLAAPGAPLVWGVCSSAFDMRTGTAPLGAIETLMINCATAEVGRAVKMPTHAYMGVSDAKTLDFQAGLESGFGLALAGLAGFDVVSGPGLIELANCQSLEKLVLDHEACRMAHRAARGFDRDDTPLIDVLRQGIAADQFLDLDHTLRAFRHELTFPGPTIDRNVAGSWQAMGATSATDRAHVEVERLLARDGAPPLDDDVREELDRLLVAS